MIGIAWNCQGLGHPTTIRHLRRLVKSHRPDFIFLSETKLSCSTSMSSFVTSLGFDCFEFVPSIGTSGGLALLWNETVNFKVVLSNINTINCIVTEDVSSLQWQFTFLYGPPIPGLRPAFWDALATIGAAFPGPWNLLGDFNYLLSPNDKHGGRAVSSTSTGGLQQLVDRFELLDLGFQGHPYTWNNRRHGAANIQERLDRCFSTVS